MAGNLIDPNKTILGGDNSLNDATGDKGVYARYPASQLKYFTSWDGSLDSQARLYVDLQGEAKDSFLNKFHDPTVKSYVSALCGDYGYIDFILENVQESYEEKSQVVELLADDFVTYFYGQKATVLNYSGKFFNTFQDDWWVAFHYLYQELLRGSKMAGFQKRVSLRYDSKLVTGALMNFSATHSAQNQMLAEFSFSIVATEVSIVPPLRSAATGLMPRTYSTQEDTDVKFTSGFNRDVLAQLTAPPEALGRGTVVTSTRDTAQKQSSAPVASVTDQQNKDAAPGDDTDAAKKIDAEIQAERSAGSTLYQRYR